MKNFDYPTYAPQSGYMTDRVRNRYIESAVREKLLPEDAHRMAQVISLVAPADTAKPIQFWQLYSVLGPQRIIAIVTDFYQRVFNDEHWFRSVFERVGSMVRHISTQSAMWMDCMGGGHMYHGGEFRLNFHHTHNALELMNEKGAERWVELMHATLENPDTDYTDDARVRPAINTFLAFFMEKYAEDFKFENRFLFGATNPPLKRRLNFLNMTTDAIEALSEQEISEELLARKIDISQLHDRQALINKALSR